MTSVPSLDVVLGWGTRRKTLAYTQDGLGVGENSRKRKKKNACTYMIRT